MNNSSNMKYLIKIMQWYHKFLFIHAKDWETRSKLIEADFERKLDELAIKDDHFMVRHTLARCRIGQKTQSELAKDKHPDVLYALALNPVVSKKTWSTIREYLDFEKELYGRFYSDWKK